MDKKIELAWLLAFYGPLLTQKQQEVLTLYCEEDMSLSEIAQQMGVSRQGIHDALHRGAGQLNSLEQKLHLLAKFRRMQDGLTKTSRLLADVPDPRVRQAADIINTLLREDEEEENGL